MSADVVEPTTRTTVRRHRDRGRYERETIYAILDEGMVCHVAACVDGVPWMIPTAYGRDGDTLYLHGAAGNHLLKAAAEGGDVCVVVTLLDGMVLARSTFNHSFNYRSVVVFGPATEITDPAAKDRALAVIVDHLLPGRSAEARPPTPSELRQTRVVALPLAEASAKVRSGPSSDDEGDLDLPVWAGVLPLRTVADAPEPDPGNQPELPEPRGFVQPARWGQPLRQADLDGSPHD
ncbi:MAG TPA: pyridoxamine 5'-phosphate oxidase family protein [Acidimicrobiales bacterium]|nr:pyridoxamine 5'-phosphate oxidase family protein [Acidimicrobiales bacterium]